VTLNQIYHLGTNKLPFDSANKVRLLNIIALITAVTSGLYTLTYVSFLGHLGVASINFGFTVAYVLTLAFSAKGIYRGGKIWFFSVLMMHLVVSSNVYLTNASGFHLYYYLVPTGTYLLFELEEKREKIILSFLAVALFFYCENTTNLSPMIVVSEQTNRYIYQSVMLVNMLEVIVVLSIFANEISVNEKKLKHQATTDSLTGIANRHTFFSQGANMLEERIEGQSVSLIILDLDYFKRVNDRHGHIAGDLVLTEVCNIIEQHCRPEDLFARIGGEEFALVMPNTPLEFATRKAEVIRSAIESHSIPLPEEPGFRCTASLGISTSSDQHDSLKDLLILADKALYNAKDAGRNRTESCLKIA
jgi:diguanylate cyclase (GGDEF)-like protein